MDPHPGEMPRQESQQPRLTIGTPKRERAVILQAQRDMRGNDEPVKARKKGREKMQAPALMSHAQQRQQTEAKQPWTEQFEVEESQLLLSPAMAALSHPCKPLPSAAQTATSTDRPAIEESRKLPPGGSQHQVYLRASRLLPSLPATLRRSSCVATGTSPRYGPPSAASASFLC